MHRSSSAAVLLAACMFLVSCGDIEKIADCVDKPSHGHNGPSEIEQLFLDQIQKQFSLEFDSVDENYRHKDGGNETVGAVKLRLKYSGFMKTEGLVASYTIFADGKEIGRGGGDWNKLQLTGGILSGQTVILVDPTIHNKTDMFHLLKTATKISLRPTKLYPNSILINMQDQEAKKVSLTRYFQ